MSKKFGKFFLAATIGAVAGGAYYFLKKKDAEIDGAFDEDDDFDDFDEDLDGEDASGEAERKYVDLDLTKAADAAADKVEEKAEQFKECLKAVNADATDKVVGAVDDVAKAADEAASKVEEFFDDDDDNDNSLDAM